MKLVKLIPTLIAAFLLGGFVMAATEAMIETQVLDRDDIITTIEEGIQGNEWTIHIRDCKEIAAEDLLEQQIMAVATADNKFIKVDYEITNSDTRDQRVSQDYFIATLYTDEGRRAELLGHYYGVEASDLSQQNKHTYVPTGRTQLLTYYYEVPKETKWLELTYNEYQLQFQVFRMAFEIK